MPDEPRTRTLEEAKAYVESHEEDLNDPVWVECDQVINRAGHSGGFAAPPFAGKVDTLPPAAEEQLEENGAD